MPFLSWREQDPVRERTAFSLREAGKDLLNSPYPQIDRLRREMGLVRQIRDLSDRKRTAERQGPGKWAKGI